MDAEAAAGTDVDGVLGLASVCRAGESLAAATAMEQPQCKSPGPSEVSEALRHCRESLCAEFAQVTGMDQAAARCILEDNQWLLEVSTKHWVETVEDSGLQMGVVGESILLAC